MTKYITSKNTIQNYFKNTKIKNIKRTQYQQFINWYIDDKKGHTHSKQSVEKLHSHAHQSLLSAVDDGILYKDPAIRITLGGDNGKDEKDKFLEADEFDKLKHYCDRNISLNHASLNMIQFAIYTGARISEIAAITRNDINVKKNQVTINKTYNYHTWKPDLDKSDNIIWAEKEKVFLPTKNHESRIIDVPATLINHLKDLANQQMKNSNNPYHLIFLGPKGTPPSDNAVNKTLKKALKTLKINKSNFTFHGLRHSHGSYLLSKGIDIQYVSKRLGHKNTIITLKVYAHVLDDLKKREAKKVMQIL